ncbi:MAG: hypothetical protein PHY09_02595 [Desulfuromonadaceae bacterium]|nr:hypothetical protein [Desulfuromonadaceae bacterium]
MPYKFEIVCSGGGDESKATGTERARQASRKSKATYENHSQKIAMTDEEIRIMDLKNRSDGYRGRQHIRKTNSDKAADGSQGAET